MFSFFFWLGDGGILHYLNGDRKINGGFIFFLSFFLYMLFLLVPYFLGYDNGHGQLFNS